MTRGLFRGAVLGAFLVAGLSHSGAAAQQLPDGFVQNPTQQYNAVTPDVIQSVFKELGYSTQIAASGPATVVIATRGETRLVGSHVSCSMNLAPNCSVVIWMNGTSMAIVPGKDEADQYALLGVMNSLPDFAMIKLGATDDGVLLATRPEVYMYGGHRGNVSGSIDTLRYSSELAFQVIPGMPAISTIAAGMSMFSALPGTGAGQSELLPEQQLKIRAAQGQATQALRNLLKDRSVRKEFFETSAE